MGQHGPSIWALTKKTGRNHLSSYFELMGLGRLTAYLSLSGIHEVFFLLQ